MKSFTPHTHIRKSLCVCVTLRKYTPGSNAEARNSRKKYADIQGTRCRERARERRGKRGGGREEERRRRRRRREDW